MKSKFKIRVCSGSDTNFRQGSNAHAWMLSLTRKLQEPIAKLETDIFHILSKYNSRVFDTHTKLYANHVWRSNEKCLDSAISIAWFYADMLLVSLPIHLYYIFDKNLREMINIWSGFRLQKEITLLLSLPYLYSWVLVVEDFVFLENSTSSIIEVNSNLEDNRMWVPQAV